MHRPFLSLPRAYLAACLAGALAAGCSDDPAASGKDGAAKPAVPAVKTLPRVATQVPRSQDPRVAACAAALEVGDLAKVQELLLQLGDEGGPDTVCLRARLMATQGDVVGAVLQLEAARKTWPDQASLFATAAEIHAAGGRTESAQEEVRAGLAVAGPTPDLQRARGILLLLQPGGAPAGLGRLLEATTADPGLPFCRGPLAEARRLLATQALAKERPEEALVHARAGLAQEPDNMDLRLLEADALIAQNNFVEALPAYEAIARDGRELGASLRMYYQRAGTAALVEGRKEVATERYLRARELGATDADLGFGRDFLAQQAVPMAEAAQAAYDEERWADARRELERALVLAPADLAYRTQLGVVAYKQGDLDAAVLAWRHVIEAAERTNFALPDPVHVNLARALHAQGKDGEVKRLLGDYLAREPEGEWAPLAREMLARLSKD